MWKKQFGALGKEDWPGAEVALLWNPIMQHAVVDMWNSSRNMYFSNK